MVCEMSSQVSSVQKMPSNAVVVRVCGILIEGGGEKFSPSYIENPQTRMALRLEGNFYGDDSFDDTLITTPVVVEHPVRPQGWQITKNRGRC